jgi:hypothetical protein
MREWTRQICSGAARTAVLASVALASGIGACSRSLPPSPPAAALYRDVERLVTINEATGWSIDRIEIDRLQSAALQSTCRVRPAQRAALLAWLDREIAARGGPVERAYRARGRRLSAVGDLLTLTRIRLVVARAAATAAADCPFWMEASGTFAGRQISDDRWQVSAAGGGKLIVERAAGDSDFRFGGAGRLLFGRVFGSRATVSSGLEMGGNGSFPRDQDGERGGLILGLDLVVPIVYRHTLVNSYIEGEAGWLGTLVEGERGLRHGLHVGGAFGARGSRTRWLFPGAALGVSVERTFPRGVDEGAVYLFKVGLRAVFDLDL